MSLSGNIFSSKYVLASSTYEFSFALMYGTRCSFMNSLTHSCGAMSTFCFVYLVSDILTINSRKWKRVSRFCGKVSSFFFVSVEMILYIDFVLSFLPDYLLIYFVLSVDFESP